MNRIDMVELWEQHTYYEFACRDADLAVSTMVPEARVMHVPTMSGASGRDALRGYYADVFIPGQPPDTELDLIARSIGDDVLVDEYIMRLTHDREVPQLLPGVPPTGLALEVAFVVIVTFRDKLMLSERLYWDQAQVLKQAGLLSDAALKLPDTSDVSGYLRTSRTR